MERVMGCHFLLGGVAAVLWEVDDEGFSDSIQSSRCFTFTFFFLAFDVFLLRLFPGAETVVLPVK